MNNLFRMLTNLEALYIAAKGNNKDAEVIRLTDELLLMGAPVYIVNRCLRYAFIDTQIEKVRHTLLSDLRVFKFSLN